MSYCVKCGVELDDSAASCALCGTPVYMPDDVRAEKQQTPFSSVPAIPAETRRKFAAMIVSVILAIPNIICGIVNLFIHDAGYWSVYVLCSCALLWVIVIFPFMTKKTHPFLLWGFDTAAVFLYTYVFFPMQKENIRNYLTVAVPIIACVSLCALIFIIWAKGKSRHWSSVMLHILADCMAVCVVIGAICFVRGLEPGVITTLIIALSDLALIVFGIYCNKSKRIRAWLKRRVFM